MNWSDINSVSNIQLWEREYRNNVEPDFWQVLEYGLVYAEVWYKPVKGGPYTPQTTIDIFEVLFPQTLVLGMTYALEEIAESELLKKKKEEAESEGKSADEIDNNTISSKEALKRAKEYLDSDYSDCLIKVCRENPKLKALVGKYLDGDRRDDLMSRIQDLRKYNANLFAPKLEDFLRKGRANSETVTVKKIFEFALGMIDDEDKYIRKEKKEEVSFGDRYVRLREQISEKITGQDEAISKFLDGLFEGELNTGAQEGPMATYLFVGPPGVGKTYLAKTAGEVLKRPFKVFQMNEYAYDSSFHGLIGFEETWKDSRPGELTMFVRSHPDAVLLFDEFEKAHINTLRQFLSVLEGGYLRDLFYKMDVDFTKTICIFTTNAGREFYEDNRERVISDIPEGTIIDALKKDKNYKGEPLIPSELLSRLAKGHIIGFDHIMPVKLLPIIRAGLREGQKLYQDRMGLKVEYNETFLSHLFMFSLGKDLDARVASARSRSFIVNLAHSVVEYESQERNAKIRTTSSGAGTEAAALSWDKKTISIDIDQKDPVAKKYLIPDRKRRFIVIARTDDVKTIKNNGKTPARFETLDWYSDNDNEKKDRIRELMDKNDVDAILIDPFFAYRNDQRGTYEGILNIRSKGIELLKWIFEQDDHPPVYILYTSMAKELRYNKADKISLFSIGVKGFLSASFNNVNTLALHVFLTERLDRLSSKGRVLDFARDYYDRDPKYEVVLRNFSERPAMDSEAADIFVNDAPGADEKAFDKVIGADNAKQELRRFVRFLQDPKKYLKSGQSVSRGILLYGPPGTGKTMLAKALAEAADCPFISVTGAEIIPEQTGKQAQGDKIRDVEGLFRLARKYSPSVLFIDEIDAFAKPRERNNDYNNRIINKILTEMNGFEDHKDKPVLVIAATNFADAPGIEWNKIYLDRALLRRFTRKIYVDLPNEQERMTYVKLLKKDLQGKKYGLDALTSAELKEFARLTAYHSLADIKNAIEIAQGVAADEEKETLTFDVLLDSFEESVYGEKMENLEDHIKTTAYHEAGHAFMAFQAEERFWPEYATVVGRGDFYGAVVHREDKGHGLTRKQLISEIRVKLAGRAAEIVFNGYEAGNSIGAASDLEKATNSVWNMICKYGMEEGFLMSTPDNLNVMMMSPLAEKYASKVNEIIDRELEYTIKCIRDNKSKVKKLGDALLKQSRLSMEQMCGILGLNVPTE